MSPTTPPPKATNTVRRSQAMPSNRSKIWFNASQPLCASPSGKASTCTWAKWGANAACTAAAYSGATVVLVTMSALLPRGKSAQVSGSDSKPAPMRMG